MAGMEGWDLLLLVVVGYLAVHLLIRLMIAHRNRVVERLREQAESPERKTVANRRKIA
jgi:hypothetical protein